MVNKMKLIALSQIRGVKVLARDNKVKQFDVAEHKNVAFAGDVYEGPEGHIEKGLAKPAIDPKAVALEGSPEDDGNPGGDEDIAALKQRAIESGVPEAEVKNLRKAEKILALIDQYAEGGGEGDDLGLEGA